MTGTRRQDVKTPGKGAILLVLGVLASSRLAAQCPDGTPPPCAGQRAAPPPPSLAVMPFETVGGDTANVYFAQGLSDELTTALAHVDRLRVIAAGASFGSGTGVLRAGRTLGVNAVLEGRVRRVGDRMRVVTQLTNARSGVLMWSNSYERDVRDVFAVQQEVAGDIVTALDAVLHGGHPAPQGSPPGLAAPRRAETANLEAYDLLLRGRYFLLKRGDGVRRSIPFFERAVALDSGYARAWANLATAWSVQPLFARVPLDSALPRARAAIATALRRVSTSAQAHTAAGLAAAYTSDWPRFESELRRAIALDSTVPDPHPPLTSALTVQGRFDEAVAQGYRALTHDPASALAASILSYALVTGRRYDEAVGLARRAIELDSLAPAPWAYYAMAQLFAGRSDAALAAAERFPPTPNTTMTLAFVRARVGGRDTAEALVRQLEPVIATDWTAAPAITFVWLAVGDTTRALDALERMARLHSTIAFTAASFGHPAYDIIRASPRFAAAVRAYGLDPRAFVRMP